MALKNSVTGEVRRTYTIPDLEDAALMMRGYDLVALNAAGSGHAGGTLSIMDITAALYLRVANHDPQDPDKIPTGRIAIASFGLPVTKRRACTSAWRSRDSARLTMWCCCVSSARRSKAIHSG